MRFTVRNDAQKFLRLFLFVSMMACSFLSVSCQTEENNVEAIVKKCQVFVDKDDLQSVSNCYAEAIRDNPQIADQLTIAGKKSVYGKCNFYKDQEDYEKAIVCYEGFSALEPNMAANYFQLADSYFKFYRKETEKNNTNDTDLLSLADESVSKGLKIKSEDIAAHILYAQILEAEGKFLLALDENQRAINLNPKIALPWINTGFIKQKLNQNDLALKDYERALEIEPENTVALYYLGSVYEKTGKINEAIETYEKLLKLDQSHEDIPPRLENLKKLQVSKKNSKANH